MSCELWCEAGWSAQVAGDTSVTPQIKYQHQADGMTRQFTAIIQREGDGYVSWCPEIDVASQGASVHEATANLREALELFFEAASTEEISPRSYDEVYVTRLDVAVG